MMNTVLNMPQRSALGLLTLLGVATCGLYLYAGYQWHADWVFAHEISKAPVVDSENQTTKLIASIPDSHMFGKSFARAGDAPISDLQFKVTGIVKVFHGKDGVTSKAYISIDNQPAKIFETGDGLPYGVKIYEITADTVIVENDGHLEKLVLPREPLVFKPKPEGSM